MCRSCFAQLLILIVRGGPWYLLALMELGGPERVSPQQAAAGGWAQLTPHSLTPAPKRAGSGGASGHVFPLSLKLGTNSRKTCEVANGIMEKVFIYFSKGAYEDLGRAQCEATEAGGQPAVHRD